MQKNLIIRLLFFIVLLIVLNALFHLMGIHIHISIIGSVLITIGIWVVFGLMSSKR